MKLYIFRTVRLPIISSLFTVHSAMVYVIQVSRRTGMELQLHPGPARKLYDIYHCWVYSEWTADDGQTNCPKNVQFHAKNKFVKLVHLVGFIKKKFVTMYGHMSRCTVTCHDARSHVTMHGHMSRCTVTCHDARSHVTIHGHMNVKYIKPYSHQNPFCGSQRTFQ